MKKYLYGVGMLALAASMCGAQSSGPSLGDLAKQSRIEKKTAKVFTNEDIASARSSDSVSDSSPQPSAAAAKPSASSAPPADKADKKDDKKKESAAKDAAASKDSPEIAQLKQKIRSFKEEQQGWKQSAKRYQDLIATETSDFRRQMYQDALQGDQNNVQLFQEKIDRAEADLAKAENSQSGH